MTRAVRSTATPVGPGVDQCVLAAVVAEPPEAGPYALHVGRTVVHRGGSTGAIQHDVHEFMVVTAGELRMSLNGRMTSIATGDHVVIEPGVWHSFENDGAVDAAMVFAFGGDPVPVTRRSDSEAQTRAEAGGRVPVAVRSLATGRKD